MERQISKTSYDAALRDAKRLRSEAIFSGWRALIDYLSPRVPKLFPAEF